MLKKTTQLGLKVTFSKRGQVFKYLGNSTGK